MRWKRLVPRSVRRWRHVLSQLDPAERRALLAAALDAKLRPGRRDWRGVVRNADHVVFVCHGNIIRSPLGEAALAREALTRGRSVQVSSAGLAARPGEPADPRAIDSAEERGLSLESHHAQLLDARQVAAARAIFIMDHINLGRILRRFQGAGDKVFLLGGCRPDGSVALTEIHDPVSGSLADVRMAHDEVMAAVRLLATAWDPPVA
jgi:protein-tyrosine phosphatase